jgi:ABC-type phosphate transport system substrate-binding protein
VKTWIAGIIGLALLAPPASADGASGYKVVVHPGIPGKRVARKTLADIFLRRTVRWGDGTSITPVDQSLTSPVRERFLEHVLEMSVDGLKSYWLREMGHGRFPPVAKEKEDVILRFVASRPGAIGYVAPDTPVPDAVKVVEVE